MTRPFHQPIEAEPVGSPSPPPRPPPLNYGPAGEPPWRFWTRQWWTQPRHQMAAGLALLGFGWACTLTYWPGPPLFVAAGAFLVGLALPVRDGSA